MKQYKVTIQRMYDYEFEVEAENEEEAIDIANEQFDKLQISGSGMYSHNEEVEELDE